MKSIKEAIVHCLEVANQCELNNKECSDNHIQLASWLEELIDYRQNNNRELLAEFYLYFTNNETCDYRIIDNFLNKAE